MTKNPIIETITTEDPALRDRTAEDLLAGRAAAELLGWTGEIDRFIQRTENLYQRVRGCLFLSAIYRFYLPAARTRERLAPLPATAAAMLRNRDWAGALARLRPLLRKDPPEPAGSAAAAAYYRLGFGFLREQVHDSIRRTPGNETIFQLASLDRYPLRVPDPYAAPDPQTGQYPVGYDCCPVRIDPCHSGWSDIFFLAMDSPRAARVINISVDIARRGEGPPRPPIECFSRTIDRPLLRLVSLDLGLVREITATSDLFNFDADRLGLLKAGVIASGLIPPTFKDDERALGKILSRLLGPGRGIELVTRVRDLPPGSRMAVSTTLLATIIARLMRHTGQILSLEGELTDPERRLIASRAILGEWLGGSGGGWQDAGGLWPGLKIITGVEAQPGDPEYGISRGRLLPDYRVWPPEELHPEINRLLSESLVLVHGGLSRDVGPVLELVTEKYLLRSKREWAARQRETRYFDRIAAALKNGEMAELGRWTTADWEGGSKEIIPAVSDAYTEELIQRVRKTWKDRYWGFLMLGGQAGGGMAFIVDPAVHRECLDRMGGLMAEVKSRYRRALPFAMEPTVFDFALNHRGIRSELRRGAAPRLPETYTRLLDLSAPGGGPAAERAADRNPPSPARLAEIGFNPQLHARHRELYRRGEIGLGRNRLPRETTLADAGKEDLSPIPHPQSPEGGLGRDLGKAALKNGEAAVVTLGGGLGSRWSGGAEVVKLLSPVFPLAGRHRCFLEIHLAKSARTGREYHREIQHALTTSFLTHGPLAETLEQRENFGFPGPVYLSPSRSIVQRLYPREEDLRELFSPRIRALGDRGKRRRERDRLDRLIRWTARMGPGEDFNRAPFLRRFHPPGHFYEIPNLIRNGTLAKMLSDNPDLKYLLVHNADTLGAGLDPAILGRHILSEKTLSFEVLPRSWEDRGGFLARVDGRCRIIEAGALPREDDDFLFTRYNSLTSWISLDPFLRFLGLDREDLAGGDRGGRVERALAGLERRIPVYLTLKEARIDGDGGGGETVPVAQCERLWGEMSGLPDLACGFIPVDRPRGRQLKDPRTLDHAFRDGSVEALTAGLY